MQSTTLDSRSPSTPWPSAFGSATDRTAPWNAAPESGVAARPTLPLAGRSDTTLREMAHTLGDTLRQLLNADLKGSALAASTFVEEVGHHLDTRLNRRDSQGDEGEMFRRVLGGEQLTAEQVDEIRSDQDAGTIQVDGKSVAVEFWNPLKKAAQWVRDKVVEPIVNTLEGAVRDVGGLIGNSVDFVGRAVVGAGRAVGDVVRAFREDGLRGAAGAVWDNIVDGARGIAGFAVSTVARTANTVVNAIDHMRGALTERSLQPAEIQALRRVYGDSIDYGAIRIQSGGMKNGAGMTAHVVDNTVWLPRNAFRADGSIDPDLLVHEMGHVWQYQNRGPGYMGDALVAQITEGRSGNLGSGSAYDWLSAAQDGRAFDAMNPESQAELAMFLGRSLDAGGELSRADLEAAISLEIGRPYTLDDAVFQIARNALSTLRAG